MAPVHGLAGKGYDCVYLDGALRTWQVLALCPAERKVGRHAGQAQLLWLPALWLKHQRKEMFQPQCEPGSLGS